MQLELALLVLGSDEYKRSVILNLSDEDEVLSFFGGTSFCVCVEDIIIVNYVFLE